MNAPKYKDTAQEIDAIQQSLTIDSDGNFRTLFHLFVRIDEVLGATAALQDEPFISDNMDELLHAQTTLMQRARLLKATTLEDLMFKMALWRRDCSDAQTEDEAMPRDTAIAFSVFQDLARLSGTNVEAIESPHPNS